MYQWTESLRKGSKLDHIEANGETSLSRKMIHFHQGQKISQVSIDHDSYLLGEKEEIVW